MMRCDEYCDLAKNDCVNYISLRHNTPHTGTLSASKLNHLHLFPHYSNLQHVQCHWLRSQEPGHQGLLHVCLKKSTKPNQAGPCSSLPFNFHPPYHYQTGLTGLQLVEVHKGGYTHWGAWLGASWRKINILECLKRERERKYKGKKQPLDLEEPS